LLFCLPYKFPQKSSQTVKICEQNALGKRNINTDLRGIRILLSERILLRIKLESFNNINIQVMEILIKEIKANMAIIGKAVIQGQLRNYIRHF
jgi:hypothetical protein